MSDPASSELVFAITSVSSATVATAAHGDAAMFTLLAAHYAQVAEAAERAGGRVVKAIGSGTILAFPVERVHDAVASLRDLLAEAGELWRTFDERCRFQVRVGAGTLATGMLGPPGHEQQDIIGLALDQLFKIPPAEFVLTAEVDALLARDGDA